MSAQQKTIDLTRVEQISKANIAMLATMHGALTEIARCPINPVDNIESKQIALTALIEVNKIAARTEVRNG